MRPRRLLLSSALLVLLASPAVAQLPKQGSFTGKLAFSSSGTSSEEGPHTLLLLSLNGPFLNDAGSGFMHLTAWVCAGINDIVNGVIESGHGYCTATDQDGDKVVNSFSGKGSGPGKGTGQFTWVSGTGKYKGITGGGTFDFSFIGTTGQGVSVTKGTWQLP